MSRLTQMATLVTIGVLGSAIAIVIPGCTPGRSAAKILYAAPDGSGTACSRRQPCSLVGAQRRVRHVLAATTGKTRNIVIELAGGTYRLTAPLRFGPGDSGRDGHTVTWAAAPGAHPVISGGSRVTGWTESDPARGIWSAKISAGIRTRQLYVDGKAVEIAQANPGKLGLDLSHWNAAGFVVNGATAKYFSRLAAHAGPSRIRGLEMAWSPMPPTDWEASECPVASIEAGIIRMAEPCWKNLTERPATIWGTGNNNVNPYELRAGSAPSAIVGALVLLTQPGQWYLDPATHTVYYKPIAGQDMAKVDVEVPRLQALLQATGTLAHPVHDLVFRGLTFTTTTWLQPSGNPGFVQVQANLHITGASNQGECRFTTPPGSCPWGGFTQPPGAIALTASHRITLRDDKFIDLGAVGVEVKYGSDDNLVQGNTFTRIASSAIWLGCSADPDPLDSSADPAASIIALCAADPASAREDADLAGSEREIMTGNVVDDNIIHHVGYGYLGAAGITLMFTRHTTISHNDVFDVPYDGLTSGAWQGHPDNATIGPTHRTDVTRNINADNAIVDNYFHDNMQVFTGDGGNIYTEGHQGRTFRHSDGSVDAATSWAHGLRISGNLFNADPPGNRAYGIAPDVGSQWIEATGNVEWGLAYSFSCHWPSNAGSELKYTGNWRSDPDDSHCPTDIGNTAIPPRPGPADVPLAVLAHAGVQGRYQALEAALPPAVDYAGVSPAPGKTPAKVLVTGSGFTRSTAVYVGGMPCPQVRFISSGVLVAVVPAGVSTHAQVTARRRTNP